MGDVTFDRAVDERFHEAIRVCVLLCNDYVGWVWVYSGDTKKPHNNEFASPRMFGV